MAVQVWQHASCFWWIMNNDGLRHTLCIHRGTAAAAAAASSACPEPSRRTSSQCSLLMHAGIPRQA